MNNALLVMFSTSLLFLLGCDPPFASVPAEPQTIPAKPLHAVATTDAEVAKAPPGQEKK